MSTTDATKRWVPVPPDCTDKLSSGALTGISLRPDERVEWLYQHNPDGTRRVTGYVITKKGQPEAP